MVNSYIHRYMDQQYQVLLLKLIGFTRSGMAAELYRTCIHLSLNVLFKLHGVHFHNSVKQCWIYFDVDSD